MKKGKLIVIEGSDGSGKTTQIKLLTSYLKKQKISFAVLDFPQYEKTFFGEFVARFLKGEFGKAEHIPSYFVALPYALDRWQAKKQINKLLAKKQLVICNRYVGSNAAYQAAKLKPNQREAFIKWLFKMEYEILGVPKEDIVIYLYVPVGISQELIDKRGQKKYLGNLKKDIYEQDIKLLTEVEKMYLSFCKKYKNYLKVDCTEKGKLLTKEKIHQKILQKLFP